MDMLLIEGIKDVVLSNGLVRIDCVMAGPGSEQRPSCTLIMPANITVTLLQSMTNAMKELEKKVQENAAKGVGKPN